jgi:C-3',4' desaturase CrtD
MASIIVIGAGIGGLTTAALLVHGGHQVTVLEAHIYPGGSAGTFFHQGYRFDAGATLAGGFSPGGPHARLAETLGLSWPVRPADPAWVTHLPSGSVTQWSEQKQWEDERRRAFPNTEPFWRTQERLAASAWDLSARHFPWPPAGLADLESILNALDTSTLHASTYALSRIHSLIPRNSGKNFKAFLDGQLMISAQTTANHANALYAAAALDLPRRGVNHVHGGIGSLARTLVEWLTNHGARVMFRQQVNEVLLHNRRTLAVRTRKGLEITADAVVANLTPWALADLLGDQAPIGLRREVRRRTPTWGAFTVYVGLDGQTLPAGLPDHHQVIINPDLPLSEGNSIFISLNDPEDSSRAPVGHRTLTLSTHTQVEPWWRLLRSDPQAYAKRKEQYLLKALTAAECILPGIRGAARLILPATPVTFQFYTRRPFGMVGGFPQTSLLRARGPRTGIPNLWLVGDSIFPGQSTAGVTLGGMRVAAEVSRNFAD